MIPFVLAVTFDPTITLGSIIQTILLIVSLFIAYNGITNRMASVETKVEAMWNHFITKVER